jgi:PAS domain S-box-containing protein
MNDRQILNTTMDHSSLLTKQVRRLYSQGRSAVFATIVNASILSFILWDVADRTNIMVWLTIILAVTCIRTVVQIRFNQCFDPLQAKQAESVRWRRNLQVMMLITGSAWGAAGIMLYPPSAIAHQSFIAFVIGGMVAGAVGLHAVYMPIFLSFSLPAALPIITMLVIAGDALHLAMATMCSLGLILMIVTAKRIGRSQNALIDLEIRNMQLIGDLKTEIEEREKAEAALRESKAQIEVEVDRRTAQLKQAVEQLNAEIEERKRVDAALRANEEKYRELVENLNDVIFALDEQGRIVYISPRIENVAGYHPDEMKGRSFAEFIYEGDLPTVIERYKKLLDGEIAPSEYRVVDKAGVVRWVRSSSRPIIVDGQHVGVRGMMSDISERKALQTRLEQAHKMEAVGRLAGGVAHDLNNILSGLVGYPELLLMDLPEDSPLREQVTAIMQSGKKASDIVQDLLILSRRGMTVIETVDLNRLIQAYLASPEFRDLTEAHPNVHIDASLAPDLRSLSGSGAHLTKTLGNLVTNALEAMPFGGKVHIVTYNRFVDRPLSGSTKLLQGDYVVLQVIDTGIGISDSDRKHIFEPFYSKKIMGRSGTGLGMAVVWGTVEDHQGAIQIDSEEGEGTTFTLFFPVTRAPVAKAWVERPAIETYLGHGERILVVDDVKAQRDIGQKFLTKLGYNVRTVTSGEEAVAFIETQSADLLVLDMIMEPGMNGLETYQKILKRFPDQKAVIASGYAETKDVKQAQRLGAGAYVRKPYTLEKLGLAVRAELDKDA